MTAFGQLIITTIAALWNSGNWALRWVLRALVAYPMLLIPIALMNDWGSVQVLTYFLPFLIAGLFLFPRITIPAFSDLWYRGPGGRGTLVVIILAFCGTWWRFYHVTGMWAFWAFITIAAILVYLALYGLRIRAVDPLWVFVVRVIPHGAAALMGMAGVIGAELLMGALLRHCHPDKDGYLVVTLVFVSLALAFFSFARWSRFVKITSWALVIIIVVLFLGGRSNVSAQTKKITDKGTKALNGGLNSYNNGYNASHRTARPSTSMWTRPIGASVQQSWPERKLVDFTIPANGSVTLDWHRAESFRYSALPQGVTTICEYEDPQSHDVVLRDEVPMDANGRRIDRRGLFLARITILATGFNEPVEGTFYGNIPDGDSDWGILVSQPDAETEEPDAETTETTST